MLAGACQSSLAMTRGAAGDGPGKFDEPHGAPPPYLHCAAANGPPAGTSTTDTLTVACENWSGPD